jgi:hypothetical protein
MLLQIDVTYATHTNAPECMTRVPVERRRNEYLASRYDVSSLPTEPRSSNQDRFSRLYARTSSPYCSFPRFRLPPALLASWACAHTPEGENEGVGVRCFGGTSLLQVGCCRSVVGFASTPVVGFSLCQHSRG